MATHSRPSFLPAAVFLLVVLSSFALQGAIAGRGVPTAAGADKKQKQAAVAGGGVPAAAITDKEQKQKQAAIAGGGVPAAASTDKKQKQKPGAAASADKKQTECLGGAEGTYLIPGIGRFGAGSTEMPSIGGLDSSGPAAANQQFLPGGEDTFVPNPGYDIPNPFHVGGATTP